MRRGLSPLVAVVAVGALLATCASIAGSLRHVLQRRGRRQSAAVRRLRKAFPGQLMTFDDATWGRWTQTQLSEAEKAELRRRLTDANLIGALLAERREYDNHAE